MDLGRRSSEDSYHRVRDCLRRSSDSYVAICSCCGRNRARKGGAMASGAQFREQASSVTPGHIADSTIVSCPATGVTVPSDYMGLSIEWSMVQHWFGTSRTSVNTSLVNLLTSLERNPTTAGVLRIGGNSQDGYHSNQHGSTAANTLFSGTINAGLVEAVIEIAERSGWKVIFGLNLRNNNPGMAHDLAKYAVGQDR